MDLPASLAAFTHYDMLRDPDDHVLEKQLPADYDYFHAWYAPTVQAFGSRPSLRLKQPEFPTGYHQEKAWCGRRVKAITPIEFDAGDPEACPDCVSALLSGQDRPSRYERWLDEEMDAWDADRERALREQAALAAEAKRRDTA